MACGPILLDARSTGVRLGAVWHAVGCCVVKKSVLDQPPRGALKAGLRLPAYLYRVGLGWLLGQRFLLLVHQGRKTGLPRRTVLEVVGHDRQSGTYYIASGWGEKSDWYLNIRANPNVIVHVGRSTFQARADPISLSESVRIMDSYAGEHPVAFRELSSLFLRERLQPGSHAAQVLAERMPMVALRPVP
jgi:deazaflavin-dependent oxidoreductase (nitroreductase family)